MASDLILNISTAVRWHDSVTLLYELGNRVAIEAQLASVTALLSRYGVKHGYRLYSKEWRPCASTLRRSSGPSRYHF